jgi:hypothetical protein
MRERLLDLCLLAYPRARRAADHDFLRDLALDLAETQGFPRQAWSLLGGGLRERIELRRRGRRPPVIAGGWAKRIVVGSSVLAALAFAATGLIAPGGGGGVSEVERFVCQYTDGPPSEPRGVPSNRRSGCRETERLIAARERAGWDCTTRLYARSGGRTTTWSCTRASNVVAWLGI